MKTELLSPQFHVDIGMLASTKCAAKADWRIEEGHWYITVDPFQHGIVTSVVHELIHRVTRPALNGMFEDDAQEEMTVGLEDEIIDRIRLNRTAFEWWRKAIYEKIKDAN